MSLDANKSEQVRRSDFVVNSFRDSQLALEQGFVGWNPVNLQFQPTGNPSTVRAVVQQGPKTTEYDIHVMRPNWKNTAITVLTLGRFAHVARTVITQRGEGGQQIGPPSKNFNFGLVTDRKNNNDYNNASYRAVNWMLERLRQHRSQPA